MRNLGRIDEKARFEDAYHAIGRCAEAFYLIAPIIPRALNIVVQRIYGRYDEALFHVFKASNTFDYEEKVCSLEKAHECLFSLQTSFEILVKGHGCSVGQANVVIDATREAYIQVNKWLNKIIKDKANESSVIES